MSYTTNAVLEGVLAMFCTIAVFLCQLKRVCLETRLLAVISALFLASVAVTFGAIRTPIGGTVADQQPPRTYEVPEDSWPKQAIELVAVHGLQSTDFPNGFELEVKNVSDKPIYYLHVEVLFPESKSILGEPGGLSFIFGDNKFTPMESQAEPTDVAIRQGATVKLKSEGAVNKFYTHLEPEIRSRLLSMGISRVQIIPQRVNFGDGTGFINASAYPVKKLALASFSFSEDCGGAGNCGQVYLGEPVTCSEGCSIRVSGSTGSGPCQQWNTHNTPCGCTTYYITPCGGESGV
jgi:hypothetical protein